MLSMSFWRRFSGRRKRNKSSFYESQHLMREATQAGAAASLRHMSDETLREIVEKENGTRRAELAREVLNQRGKPGGVAGGAA